VQAALAQAAAPLLDAVKKDPKDFDSLVKLGNLYYDGKQFPSAIQYYERALAIHPENPDVRTDMGTAYWYTGDAEKALAAMETSLKYRPGHPQTLFNLGWVRWQGKQDPKGRFRPGRSCSRRIRTIRSGSRWSSTLPRRKSTLRAVKQI
jgi:Tfp pilus assembly protein PilF